MLPAVTTKVACFGMDRNHFKIQCVCVYLEISVNTRSFKNCSTHNSYLFHPHSVWFLLQQTKCSTKFRSPRRIGERNFAPQINCCAKFRFPKRNFKRNFVVRGTKCHAKFRTLARNFNDMGTIGAPKYRRKFAFFEISHNFGKISSKFDEIRSHYFCTVL